MVLTTVQYHTYSDINAQLLFLDILKVVITYEHILNLDLKCRLHGDCVDDMGQDSTYSARFEHKEKSQTYTTSVNTNNNKKCTRLTDYRLNNV